MSGGSLDYFYSSLESHDKDLGDPELNELVRDLAHLFYEREWYLSGDTNEGNWREARDSFKKKWFGKGTRKELVEKYLADLREEVLDGLGLSEQYCRNCQHWTPEKEKDSPYGNCDMRKGCLWHRSEKCEKFVKRDTAHGTEEG